MRTFYLICGLVAVGLGLVGIVLPLLPTTPFLLLALWCFSRSSLRMQAWLVGNRLFGRYIRDYQNGKGIPRRVKVYILVLLWGSLTACGVWLVPYVWARLLFFAVGVGVTTHVVRIKTKERA